MGLTPHQEIRNIMLKMTVTIFFENLGTGYENHTLMMRTLTYVRSFHPVFVVTNIKWVAAGG